MEKTDKHEGSDGRMKSPKLCCHKSKHIHAHTFLS